MTRSRKLMIGSLLGLGSAVLWSLFPPGEGESKGLEKARILATASVQGEVVPCG